MEGFLKHTTMPVAPSDPAPPLPCPGPRSTSLCLMVSAMVPVYSVGFLIAALFNVFFMISSGFLLNTTHMPPFLLPFKYMYVASARPLHRLGIVAESQVSHVTTLLPPTSPLSALLTPPTALSHHRSIFRYNLNVLLTLDLHDRKFDCSKAYVNKGTPSLCLPEGDMYLDSKVSGA